MLLKAFCWKKTLVRPICMPTSRQSAKNSSSVDASTLAFITFATIDTTKALHTARSDSWSISFPSYTKNKEVK